VGLSLSLSLSLPPPLAASRSLSHTHAHSLSLAGSLSLPLSLSRSLFAEPSLSWGLGGGRLCIDVIKDMEADSGAKFQDLADKIGLLPPATYGVTSGPP